MNKPQMLSPTAEEFARARAGDRAALCRMFERIRPRLYRFCFYLTGDRHSGEDLSQEVYLKVLTHLDRLEDPQAVTGWIFTIARNQFLDRVRRKREQVGYGAAVGERLVAQGASGETAARIHETMAALEPDDRFLLVLVHLEGRSYAEAAAICAISEGAVKARLHKIRKLFQGAFFTGKFVL